MQILSHILYDLEHNGIRTKTSGKNVVGRQKEPAEKKPFVGSFSPAMRL
jgi:hypothetical protein